MGGGGGGAEVGGRPKERAERRKERKENKGKQAKYMIIQYYTRLQKSDSYV